MSMNRRYFLHSAAAATMCLSAGGCGKQPQERDEEPDPTKSGLFTAKLVARAELPEVPLSLALSPDGKTAVTGGDRFLRFWSLPDAKPVKQIPAARAESKEGKVCSVAYFPDGKRVMAFVADDDQSRLGIWDIAVEKEIHQPLTIPAKFTLSTSGSLIAFMSEGIQVWDVKQSKRLHHFKFDERDVTYPMAVDISPDGQLLAVGFSEGRYGGKGRNPNLSPLLRVWDLKTGDLAFKDWETTIRLFGVRFSPDGKQLAAGGDVEAPALRIWDVASRRVLHSLPADDHAHFSLAFHPRGRVLASGGSDNLVHLWDTRKGRLLERLKEHSTQVHYLEFSRDGRLLITVGNDRQFLVWETRQL